jgi:DNA-binding NarL/FixJ family response regulator
MPVSIFLADDHHVVRQGLRSLLEAQPDFVVVGEAADGLETVQQVERLKPNVLVLDLMMPGLYGLEVARQVQGITRVVILSMHASEAYVLEALQNGAYGYVLKDSTAADLVQAVRSAYEGRRFLSQPFSELAIAAYVQRSQSTPLDPYNTLTTREREVLQLMAEGHTNNEISSRLSISPRTVEVHRANAQAHLAQPDRTDSLRAQTGYFAAGRLMGAGRFINYGQSIVEICIFTDEASLKIGYPDAAKNKRFYYQKSRRLSGISSWRTGRSLCRGSSVPNEARFW